MILLLLSWLDGLKNISFPDLKTGNEGEERNFGERGGGGSTEENKHHRKDWSSGAQRTDGGGEPRPIRGTFS